MNSLDILKKFDQKTKDRLVRREREAYRAIKTFPLLPEPKTYEEHELNLARFFSHHFEVTSGGELDPVKDVHESMYREPLESRYGERWRLITFRMAESGVEGGLLEVFKSLSFGLSDLYAKRGIQNSVDRMLEGLASEQIERLSVEYIKRWKAIVPRELYLKRWIDEEGSLCKDFFEKVLNHHPYWVRDYEIVFEKTRKESAQ